MSSRPVLYTVLVLGVASGCREPSDPFPYVKEDAPCCAPPGPLRDLPPRYDRPRVELVQFSGDEPYVVVVMGIDERVRKRLTASAPDDSTWPNLFSVRTGDGPDLPAIPGEYRWNEAGEVVFEPTFPLVAGLEYHVAWTPAAVGLDDIEPTTARVALPAPSREPVAEIVEVYPTTDVWPENLLRIYLHFSQPMSRGLAYEHVHLLDANGDEVQAPFLELGEELWNEDGTRFTLLFDPGRIKRELVPNREEGPPLRAGAAYTLVVDTGWLDADGRALTSEFRRDVRVIEPDATSPDPRKWTITAPADGESAALVVDLDETLDHALLHRVLDVVNEQGEPVAGEVVVGPLERTWSFVPVAPWTSGTYALVVDPILADPQGNSVGRPFEVALDRPDESREEPVRLPFVVGEK